MTPTATTSVILHPHQVPHVSRLLEILSEEKFALDLSMLGTGKTYTSTAIAEKLELPHVIVIAPVSVKPKWALMRDMHGLPLKKLLSYSELRASRCRQPKHGLLARRDYKQHIDTNEVHGDDREIDKVEFTPSEELTTMVEEGILVVIDESQSIKNMSAQFHATHAIIEAITSSAPENRSRVLIVSGSPIDRLEQASHLFRCLGVMKSPLSVYNPYYNRFNNKGYLEVLRYCEALPGYWQPWLGERNNVHNGAAACYRLAYMLFQGPFKESRAASMEPPKMEVAIKKYNGYFDIGDEKSKNLLEMGVKKMADAVRYDAATGSVDHGGADSAQTRVALSMSMMMIETAKIPTFIRLTREALQNPGKVVVCVNYSASLRDIVEALSDLDPLVMQGSMNYAQRGTTIEKFQHDKTRRVLVANLSLIASGIDLDDVAGDNPRTCFVSPNYSTITLYQLGHRFIRLNTKSSSELYMVYGQNASETRVLDALGRKSEVMKTTADKQAAAGVVFPGDYPTFCEVHGTFAKRSILG